MTRFGVFELVEGPFIAASVLGFRHVVVISHFFVLLVQEIVKSLGNSMDIVVIGELRKSLCYVISYFCFLSVFACHLFWKIREFS